MNNDSLSLARAMERRKGQKKTPLSADDAEVDGLIPTALTFGVLQSVFSPILGLDILGFVKVIHPP